jgi:hypothetical protein
MTASLFTVTLTAAELEVAALALGRFLDPKPVPKPRAKAAPRVTGGLGKPPRLTPAQHARVSSAWAHAVGEARAFPEDREHRMRQARAQGEAFCLNGR